MSLTWKIFFATAAVVTAVLGGSLILTNHFAQQARNESVDKALNATREQVITLLQAREEGIRKGAEVFASNRPFGSVVEQRKREDVLDQSLEAVQQTSADWVQITDNEGIRLAKSNEPAAAADTLAASALIGGALAGNTMSGVGISGDSVLYQAVSVPIPGAGENTVVGVLMATKKIDSALAASIKSSAGNNVDVVFYLLDRDNKPRIVTSTLGRTADLEKLVQSRSSEDSSRADAMLGADHYVGQGGVLRSASSNPLGGFIVLRSRDAELGAFTTLRNIILIAGGLGLVLTFVLAYLLAKQITRPVSSLVSAARMAAQGNYSTQIPQEGDGEIKELASAFNALLDDLRDKQALVDFMSSQDSGKTIPIARHADSDGKLLAGRYDLKEILGAGGMGTVYRAVDKELDETVAVKTLKAEMLAEDPSALERFKSEIRLARRISHQNVVRTHDFGEANGTYFITMEYVEGKSLKDLIRARGGGGKLPLPIVLTIGKQLSRALEVAHEQGIIHRDIKPQNMVVEPDGVLKVMDFGIARLASRKEGVTQAGMVVGTPEYMAPEQLMGNDVDARIDLYAAGVVLYECLTGRLPFVADSQITLITKVLEEIPADPRVLNPEVPMALSELVMRALAKDRNSRPRTATDLHDSLARLG